MARTSIAPLTLILVLWARNVGTTNSEDSPQSEGVLRAFATPVWLQDDLISAKQVQALIAAVDRERSLDPEGSVESNAGGWQSRVGEHADGASTRELDRAISQFLAPQVLASCAEFLAKTGTRMVDPWTLKTLEVASVEIWMNDWWANVNGPGDSNSPHVHRGYISGAVFLQSSGRSSGALTFDDPRMNSKDLVNPTEGRETFEIEPVASRLALWPPWLEHAVGPNLADDASSRYSIAFNLKASSANQYGHSPPVDDKCSVSLNTSDVLLAACVFGGQAHSVPAAPTTDTRNLLWLWASHMQSGYLAAINLPLARARGCELHLNHLSVFRQPGAAGGGNGDPQLLYLAPPLASHHQQGASHSETALAPAAGAHVTFRDPRPLCRWNIALFGCSASGMTLVGVGMSAEQAEESMGFAVFFPHYLDFSVTPLGQENTRANADGWNTEIQQRLKLLDTACIYRSFMDDA